MALRKCPPAKSLYIGIPTYTGAVEIQTALCLATAMHLCLVNGINVTTGYVAQGCYLDHARNEVADLFLKSDCTDLLFLDGDLGFDPISMVKIAKLEVPLVAGVYPRKLDNLPNPWPVKFRGEEVVADPKGLISVLGAPTGFMRINRGIFTEMDRLAKPPYPNQFMERYTLEGPDAITVTAYFRQVIRDGSYYGEDYEFCYQWLAMGGECMVMPDIAFQHSGRKTWSGNLQDWLNLRIKGAN